MVVFPLHQSIFEFLYIRPLCKRGELFYCIIFNMYLLKTMYPYIFHWHYRSFIYVHISSYLQCISHNKQFQRMHMYAYMHIHTSSAEQKKRVHASWHKVHYRHSFSLLQKLCYRRIQSLIGQWTQAALFSNQFYLGVQS